MSIASSPRSRGETSGEGADSGNLRRILLAITIVAGVLAPVAAILLTLHIVNAHPGVEPYGYLEDGWLTQLVLVPLTMIMVSRRPKHSVTYIFVALTALAGLQQLSGTYAAEGLVAVTPPLTGAIAAQLGEAVFQGWAIFGFLLLLAVFPSGRTIGRVFAWIPGAIGAVALLAPVFNILAEETPFPSDGETAMPAAIEAIKGPLSSAPSWLRSAGGFVVALLTFAILLSVVVQVFIRFRRSKGVERQQFRWFFYSVILALVLFVGFPLLIPVVLDYVNPWAVVPAVIVGSMALAILRYRLYDIDRIVSRTITYSVVVGFAGLVFAAGVVWIPSVFELGESPLLVAASTLTIAAVFNPLRRRVQRFVDRRFNRSRYDAEQIVTRFSGSLRERVDGDQLVSGWLGVVSETMQPREVGVWVKGQ